MTTTDQHNESILCPLCLQSVREGYYEEHMQIHEQAEMLADILALSRR